MVKSWVSEAMLLNAGESFHRELLLVLTAKLNGDLHEVDWSNVVVTLLPKSAVAESCKDCRPISVLSTVCNLYERLLIH